MDIDAVLAWIGDQDTMTLNRLDIAIERRRAELDEDDIEDERCGPGDDDDEARLECRS